MFGLVTSQGASDQDARLRRIERKLDQITRHLGIDADEPDAVLAELDAEVRSLADVGQKIQAIKRHREVTGADLKEAKDAVELYIARR